MATDAEASSGMRKRAQVADEAEAAAPATGSRQNDGTRDNRGPPTRCQRFLRSRYFKMCTISLVSIVPVFGVLFFLPVAVEKRCASSWFCKARHTVLGWWLSVQFVYNFVMVGLVDPGGCTQIKPTNEPTGQFAMELGLGDNAPANAPSSLLFAPSFCEMCQHWKPPRSHHCSICRRCVLRMDHHCPFTGNCIGMRNHGHFLLFYIFAFVGLVYSLWLCIAMVSAMKLEVLGKTSFFSEWWKSASKFGGLGPGFGSMMTSLILQVVYISGLEVAFQTMATLIALVFVVMVGIPAMQLAFTNTTLLEAQFPMKEYVQIKPEVYCPLGPGFYRQKRFWQNLQLLLGRRWWLRLLLPVRGSIDVSVAISPSPSEAGAKALLDRIKQVEEQGVAREVRSCTELGINPGPAATPGV
eukprot:gnl/TRDRNA2_/TRDRNA2_154373_c5_seq2.p1 gnl/TRDRNA2_/TRDRNA2_154373_c5~~gnl/TRDRNA2_/TRDRNA2_154373_c5_seq2.p1  ORF type:complete len:426 (+),score=49.00 gnl/TRDRNA2_/TRDRNA2_154373_c5_seq2:48-1280(+)